MEGGGHKNSTNYVSFFFWGGHFFVLTCQTFLFMAGRVKSWKCCSRPLRVLGTVLIFTNWGLDLSHTFLGLIHLGSEVLFLASLQHCGAIVNLPDLSWLFFSKILERISTNSGWMPCGWENSDFSDPPTKQPFPLLLWPYFFLYRWRAALVFFSSIFW